MSSSPAQPSDRPVSTKDTILETGAAIVQEFKPINQICAHLNALHVYASDPTRCVEANHYCSHVSKDLRQCLLYDSPEKGAKLLGVEYMITPELLDLPHVYDLDCNDLTFE